MKKIFTPKEMTNIVASMVDEVFDINAKYFLSDSPPLAAVITSQLALLSIFNKIWSSKIEDVLNKYHMISNSH